MKGCAARATRRRDYPDRVSDQQTSAAPATFGRRFAALLIDWVLCLLTANIFANPMRDGWSPVVVLIGLYAIFAGLFAQTPGMAVLRIRCVDATTGGRIGIWRGLIRGVLLCLVIPPLLTDRNGRALHDRTVNSIVLH